MPSNTSWASRLWCLQIGALGALRMAPFVWTVSPTSRDGTPGHLTSTTTRGSRADRLVFGYDGDIPRRATRVFSDEADLNIDLWTPNFVFFSR